MVTHYVLRVAAYLLIGCLFMLGFNELAPVNRKQFVAGMMIWPVMLGATLLGILHAYVRRVS